MERMSYMQVPESPSTFLGYAVEEGESVGKRKMFRAGPFLLVCFDSSEPDIPMMFKLILCVNEKYVRMGDARFYPKWGLPFDWKEVERGLMFSLRPKEVSYS